jgi:hypothetical protein
MTYSTAKPGASFNAPAVQLKLSASALGFPINPSVHITRERKCADGYLRARGMCEEPKT